VIASLPFTGERAPVAPASTLRAEIAERNRALTFSRESNTAATSDSSTTATTGHFIRDANRFGFACE